MRNVEPNLKPKILAFFSAKTQRQSECFVSTTAREAPKPNEVNSYAPWERVDRVLKRERREWRRLKREGERMQRGGNGRWWCCFIASCLLLSLTKSHSHCPSCRDVEVFSLYFICPSDYPWAPSPPLTQHHHPLIHAFSPFLVRYILF